MRVNGPTLEWETYDTSNMMLDLFTLHSRVPIIGWQTNTPVGGLLQLTVRGKADVSYAVESSTNLVNWTSFTTNTMPLTEPPSFTVPVAVSGSHRWVPRPGCALIRTRTETPGKSTRVADAGNQRVLVVTPRGDSLPGKIGCD